MEKLATISGVVGSLMYVIPYGLLQFGVIEAREIYSFLYLLSAILCMNSLVHKFNLGSMMTQVCWIFFSMVGLYRQEGYNYMLAAVFFLVITTPMWLLPLIEKRKQRRLQRNA